MKCRLMFFALISFGVILFSGCKTTGELIKVPAQPGLAHDQTTGKIMGLSPLHEQHLLKPPPFMEK